MAFPNLKTLFRPSEAQLAARALLATVLVAARQPEFYTAAGAADTLDGRFDIAVTHLYVVLRRLKGEGEKGRDAAQALFDAAFANFDEGLRKTGVGDLSIGKKIRKMAEAFYGRVTAYETAQAEGQSALEEAMVRNVYRGHIPSEGERAALFKLVHAFREAVECAPLEALLSGAWSYKAATTP